LSENILLTEGFTEKVSQAHSSIKDYLSYILLDLVFIDSSIEEPAFGWSFQLSGDLGLKTAFDAVVKKELNHSDKKLQQHRTKSLSAFYEVKETESEQIYE
jgi:hypothetical protein